MPSPGGPPLPNAGRLTLTDPDSVEGFVGVPGPVVLSVGGQIVAETVADRTDILGNPGPTGGFRFGCLDLAPGTEIWVMSNPPAAAAPAGDGLATSSAPQKIVATGRIVPSADYLNNKKLHAILAETKKGDYTDVVIRKLFHFRMTADCWSKWLDTQSDPVRKSAFWARSIARYAKRVELGDIEATLSGSRPRLEALVGGMCGKIRITMLSEAPACHDLAQRLVELSLTEVVEGLLEKQEDWKPKTSSLHVRLVVTPRVSKPSLVASADGRFIEVLAPSEVEATDDDWTNGVRIPFKSVGK